jgi:hypothetical protein
MTTLVCDLGRLILPHLARSARSDMGTFSVEDEPRLASRTWGTRFRGWALVAVDSAFVEVGVVEVFDEGGVAFGVPAEALLGLGAGGGAVGAYEEGEEAEVFGGFFGGFADGGEVEAAADGFGDFAGGDALFSDGVVAVSGFALLNGEAVEMGGIEQVGGGPAVLSVADVGGDSLLAGDGGEVAAEAGLVGVVDLG